MEIVDAARALERALVQPFAITAAHTCGAVLGRRTRAQAVDGLVERDGRIQRWAERWERPTRADVRGSDVPDSLLAALRKAPHELGREVRVAEFAGLTRSEFLAELARRRVDVFVVDEEDLARELRDA